MIKKAMILAAGFGKRLNPLTLNCPKPLLQIGNETLLSNAIHFLEQFEIKQVVINIHHLGDQIVEKILNTGGGILNALKHFNENFLCINPDTIWNINYIKELKKMEGDFFLNKKKCCLLVVDKIKSFDSNLKGDFNLQSGLITRNKL